MDSKYILGIDELDSQHEGIESLCIELQEAIEDKVRWRDILEKLCEKLRFHFYAEESIMEIFSYPESQEHKRSHREVMKFFENYKDITLTDANIKELRDQPLQVFSDQVLAQDMRFASFIKRNKERLGVWS